MTSIPLTESGIQSVKRALQVRFPRDKSAHLTEALASACGFKSHAALLVAMKAGNLSDPEYILLDDTAFLIRISELKSPSDDGNHGFSFDHLKYSSESDVIKTRSLRFEKIDYSKSLRKSAWRNAMVAGINAGIEQKLFSVRPGDNRWPGASQDSYGRSETSVYEFELGSIPAVASVHDGGFDELSIHVALWPTPEGRRWVRTANGGFSAGELFATGWLERRDGAWLQVPSDVAKGWSFACRKHRLNEAATVEVRPKGYADRGSFKL